MSFSLPPEAKSRNATKALIERLWLEYTLVWGGVMGFVMLTGLGSIWQDLELMVLGILLGLGPLMYPWLRFYYGGASGGGGVVISSGDFFKTLRAMYLGITTLSIVMHYIATPFFFDVLHMHYGFNVTIRIDRNPVFLYPLTIAYFATYCVMGCMCYRYLCAKFNNGMTHGTTAFIFNLIVSFNLALFETLLNANPFIADLFCYDDNFFALTFGSFAYGMGFVFSIPVWINAVPDGPPFGWTNGGRRGQLIPPGAKAKSTVTPPSSSSSSSESPPELVLKSAFIPSNMLRNSIAGNVLAELVHGIVLWYLRHHVAPIFTTVVEDSPPMGGCLTARYSLV